jgi:hypothetical protein
MSPSDTAIALSAREAVMSEALKLAKCYSGAVSGVSARTVEIEVCASPGSPQFTIVGLPDTAVKEAKDRVSTAVANSGFKRPENNITVNLAPADVRKEGPLYDLPIAICLLAAAGKLKCNDLSEWGMVGELALSGEVRRVRGVLPIVMEMRRIGKKGVLVPVENAEEAAVVNGISIYPVRTLRDATEFLRGQLRIAPVFTDISRLVRSGRDTDKWADCKLTPIPANGLSLAPAIAECPGYLACKVRQVIELGSHVMFIGEVVGAQVQDKYFDPDGSMHLERAELVAKVHGVYQQLSPEVKGFFGYSVARPDVFKRRMAAYKRKK